MPWIAKRGRERLPASPRRLALEPGEEGGLVDLVEIPAKLVGHPRHELAIDDDRFDLQVGPIVPVHVEPRLPVLVRSGASRYRPQVIELNELLVKSGLDPSKIMVMRHRPTERDLRRALPWLALESPDIFDAYQCCHGPRVEKSLSKASHLVSFIGHEASRALFIGIYEVGGWREISSAQWHKMPTSKRLLALGDRGPADGRTIRWFDLLPSELLASWKGRLVIDWPGIERSWWRWAGRNQFLVQAIHQDSALIRSMPPWKELVLSWTELQALPRSWQVTLAQWRGIYLILDRATGKSYVGSAYGSENIQSRWQSYAATGHGGNVELKRCDPASLQFSILERVSPDLPADDVIRLEASWKSRLGTREFGLNRN